MVVLLIFVRFFVFTVAIAVVCYLPCLFDASFILLVRLSCWFQLSCLVCSNDSNKDLEQACLETIF